MGGGLGHGQPRSGTGRRGAVGRVDARDRQGLGDDPHRYRRFRGRGDHRGRPGPRQRQGGGLRAGRGLRLRADRDADEERGGGPGEGRRALLQLMAAVRDRRRRGRRAFPAPERSAGRGARRGPAAAHLGRRADQLLLRGNRLRRERAGRRLAAGRRDRRRGRDRLRLHPAVPLAGRGPRPRARSCARRPEARRMTAAQLRTITGSPGTCTSVWKNAAMSIGIRMQPCETGASGTYVSPWMA